MRIPFITLKATPLIEVVCVAYKRYGPLKVLVQSFLNQTAPNWKLTVIHDGADAEFDRIMAALAAEAPDKIKWRATGQRYNDYGHSLRDLGLKDADSDYVLVTNDDNYYIPRFIEILTEAIQKSGADAVYFDMIHSHNKPGGRPQPSYCLFETDYKRHSIDMGAAVVRTELAKAAGFRDKTHDGDATYFEDVAKAKGKGFKTYKVPRVMLVHN
jgi:glycosyltransferase involved in cell wall biosynthesis